MAWFRGAESNMPSVISNIFRYHPKPDTPGPPGDGDIGQSKPKKRLSRFFLSDEKQMKKHAPADKKTPQPQRASTYGVPVLPSLPIYQSFTAGIGLSLPTEHEQQPEESAESPRLQYNGQLERVERPSGKSDTPPVHDRAVELANIYKSLLPNLETIYDEEPSYVPEHSQKTSPPRETLPTHRDQGNPVSPPRHFPMAPRHNGRPSLPPSSVPASTAAVETSINGHAQAHGQLHNQTKSSSPKPTQGRRDSATQHENWPLPCPMREPIPESARPPTPPPELTPRDRRRSVRLSQYNSGDSGTLGLQICTKMLIDQLNKALNAGESENGNTETESTRNLEILLLIEAYESVMENCQRELLALICREEEEDEGRSGRLLGLERATQVLEHWLDTLYALYEQPLNGHGVDI